jgi:hypothetical protein
MQGTNRVGHGPGLQRPIETARLEDPSSRLRLARGHAPPRSGLRPARGATPSSNGLRPVRGATLPSSGPAPLEGTLPLERVPARSRVRSAPGWGPPRSRAPRARVRRPRTWAFNALTPQDGAIMRPGLTPRCRRTNSPGRSPSPPLWGGPCGTAGVSPITPCARYCTTNAPDPRKGAGRTLDPTFP